MSDTHGPVRSWYRVLRPFLSDLGMLQAGTLIHDEGWPFGRAQLLVEQRYLEAVPLLPDGTAVILPPDDAPPPAVAAAVLAVALPEDAIAAAFEAFSADERSKKTATRKDAFMDAILAILPTADVEPTPDQPPDGDQPPADQSGAPPQEGGA